ncbi:MAG: DegT/DnrJ/EryC1/StrS family aminotransferase [Actinomycetes bacterium]
MSNTVAVAPPQTRVPFADLAALTVEVRAELDAAWTKVVDSERFVGGPLVERFEEEWAAYCGTTCAVAVGNGTDSLQLILRALGIGPGDEVVLPGNTFIATAEAVLLAGAVPCFVDVDPDTLLLDAAAVQAALTPRTAAVIAVHLYGQMADMAALGRVANRAGVALIEDAAQAHGARWGDRRAGSVGVAGSFSFYPGKNLGAFGDGGAVTTSDQELARRVRSMREHGRSEDDRYVHDLLGTNSRLDALQAAVLSAKLRRLDEWTSARQAVAAAYRATLPGALRLVEESPTTPSVYHLAVIRTEGRDDVMSFLARAGVDTGIHYPVPCHLQEPYRAYADEPLTVAERAAREVVSLPMFPHMSRRQVTHVCAALAGAITTY